MLTGLPPPFLTGEELDSWVNDKSNFVFVGDSCHPMLPYLAQGANSAVEDGAVLGQLLGRIKSRDQVPKALKMYESLRKARGEAVVRETFKQVSCNPMNPPCSFFPKRKHKVDGDISD